MKSYLRLSLTLLLCLCVTLSPLTYAFADSQPVVITNTWEEFATALSEIVQENEDQMLSSTDSVSRYAAARLIVKMQDELPDISRFEPTGLVRDPENHYIIQFRSGLQAEECAAYLETLDNVIYVEPDEILSVSGEVTELPAPTEEPVEAEAPIEMEEPVEAETPDEPTDLDEAEDEAYLEEDDIPVESFYANALSWGVAAVHADEYAADLVNRGKTGPVIVGVVDSGADLDHPMLSGRLVPGYDFMDNDAVPEDEYFHGTHVSGIIVDSTPGLNVYVMPIRVMNQTGPSTNVALGVRYATDHGARVVNMSTTGNHTNYLEEAVQYAIQHGVTVVTAAGNGGLNVSTRCPAHMPEAITVAAVDNKFVRHYLSNYGNTVDISAPGMLIYSAVLDGKYASKDGTSMATPYVSAAAAMLQCDMPGLSPYEVSSLLCETATDYGDSDWDPFYGYGVLNLESFVQTGVKHYTITYNANGGTSAPSPQRKTQGQSIRLHISKPMRGDGTSLTIKLDLNGGTGPSEVAAKADITYSFKNWNTKRDGTGTSYNPLARYSADERATLYAQWTATYKNIGSVTLPTPTRTGYRFLGWAESATATTAKYKPGATFTPSKEMTLYAVWKLDIPETDCTLPADLTVLEEEVLAGTAFRCVKLPAGLTTIGSRAFNGCQELVAVYIPASVTEIASDAFEGAPEGVLLIGSADSAAEAFAAEKGFPFIVEN